MRKTARRRPGKAGPRVRAAGARVAGRRAGGRAIRARDLMTRVPVTVSQEMSVGELCDLLQQNNINGAPVVDKDGLLVGVVTQEDIIYGAMGHPIPGERGAADPPGPSEAAPGGAGGRRGGRKVMAMLKERRLRAAPQAAPRAGEKPFWSEGHRAPDPMDMPIASIMTSPAISADEDTPVADLCRIMWNLRIHRVPILRKGRVTGLVSSMDLCRAILDGTIKT
jgi:CBS domain-containing protein